MAHAPSTLYLVDDKEDLITKDGEDTEEHLRSEEKPSSSTQRDNYGAIENESVNESANSGHSQSRQQPVPEFRFLEVSDTGHFVPWNNHAMRKLKPGDEVAWLRPWSCYDHAIVCGMEESSITVIKVTGKSITESTKQLSDKSCLSGPLFKVHYPDDVLRTNPDREVLNKAYSSLQGRGFQLSNNCEHFTTWCKGGQKQSKQYKQKCFNKGIYCSTRLLQAARIPLIIFFADFVENKTALSDAFGAMLLVMAELLYLIIVCVLIMNDVDKGQDFIANQPQSIGKRMKWAFFKTLLQSISMIVGAIILGVVVKNILIICLGPWERFWQIVLEFGLGMLGGLLGNILGFFLFFFCQHLICIKLIKPHICPDYDDDTTPPSLDSSDSCDEDHSSASRQL